MASLKLGSTGPRVTALQQLLQQRGFDPGSMGGQFDAATDQAVRAFQASVGLGVDGQAGPKHVRCSGGTKYNVQRHDGSGRAALSRCAPRERPVPASARAQGPYRRSSGDKSMVLMALGTIRAETGVFLPIDEGTSKFNTSPGGHPFDLYVNRADLGNRDRQMAPSSRAEASFN